MDYLAGAYESWVAAGFPDHPGQDRVVGYLFPTPGLLSGLPLRTPAATHARAGRFCYDTMTLVGPGTYRAARAAADAALDRRGPRSIRSTRRLRRMPPAGTPCHPRRVRRLLLLEQRSDFSAGPARGRP
ncbi:MAG: hypothetical protein V9G10_13660 [Candidatus Nanopelagicales bacterium]